MMAVADEPRASDLPDDLRACARAIEAAVPHGRTTTAGATTAARGATRRAAVARGLGALAPALRRASSTGTRARSRRDPRRPSGHARHRQPLHRGLPRRGASASGSCSTAARAASATASGRTSSSSRRRTCARRRQPAGPGPRVPAGGHGALRRLRRGGRLGAGLRVDEPRADDGARRRGRARPCRGVRRSRPASRPSTATTTTSRASTTTARTCFVTRKGAVRARRRRARHHPRQHGRALVHRARQGQPRELRELQPRRGPRDVARRGEAAVHASTDHAAGDGAASSAARTRT